MKRIVIVTVLAGLAACGAAPKQGETLIESVRVYHEGIRWDRLPVAATRVPPAERDDFVDERDQLGEDLRIADWEVVRVTRRDDGDADVHVKYTWYREREGVVRETHARQRWAQRGKVWMIVDEHRLRGEEMPGIPEPPPAEDDGDGDGVDVDVDVDGGAGHPGKLSEGAAPGRGGGAQGEGDPG